MVKRLVLLILLILLGYILYQDSHIELDRIANKSNLNDSQIVLKVPLEFSNENSNNWSYLGKQIRDTKSKYIQLEWNGYGGYQYMARKFINSLIASRNTGHLIYFEVNGYAASMHAVSVCYGDTFKFVNHGYLFFHMVYIRLTENGDKYYVGYNDFPELDECIKRGIISSKEADLIKIEHKAIIVNSHGSYVVEDEK